jgi:hypothetical protein
MSGLLPPDSSYVDEAANLTSGKQADREAADRRDHEPSSANATPRPRPLLTQVPTIVLVGFCLFHRTPHFYLDGPCSA